MNSKHKKTLLIASLLGLLIAGFTGLFFLTHEKVETEVQEPSSGEAKHNDYLALERLLSRLDHGAVTVRKLSEPDDTHTTIILADRTYGFSPEQVDAWVEWVQGGGHLVLAQPLDGDEKTAPLLAKLGYSPVVANDGPTSSEPTWPEDAVETSFSIDQVDGDEPALQWVAADADWLARATEPGDDDSDETDDSGGEPTVFSASRPEETGRVTLLGDTSIFDNDRIGKAEHATLAAHTLDLSPYYSVAHPSVTIVLYGKRQSWMLYVLGYTWPFFTVVLVALFLAIRAGRNRFGPVLADPPAERRNRREHIDAVGRFLWQQGAIATLIESTQKALMDELEHRRPSLGHAEGAERHEIVAEELGIPPDQARQIFRKPSGNRDAQTFTEQIHILEEFRRKL